MDSSIPSDGVPAERIIAVDARHRFSAMDLAAPDAWQWSPPYVRYNKTQPDRVCPVCAVHYLPLPGGVAARSPDLERVEAERRLSGFCSIACFRSAIDAFDSSFGRSADCSVGDVHAGVSATRTADGSVTLQRFRTVPGSMAKSESTISDRGVVLHTSMQECGRCSVGSAGGKGLSLCSGCHGMMYCSPACQLADWPRHKAACLTGKRVLKALANFRPVSPPSSGIRAEPGPAPLAATFHAGSTFVVSGIASRPELNGCIAVVKALTVTAQACVPPGRIPVAVYVAAGPAEQLLLNPASLVPLPSPTPGALDWAITVTGHAVSRNVCGSAASHIQQAPLKLTLLDLISCTPIGDLDVGHELIAALQLALRPPAAGPVPPARLFSRAAIRSLLRAPSHEVCWMPFDAISHSFVVEVLPGGHGRLFQSSVRSLKVLTGGEVTVEGYSAREWAHALPRDAWGAPLRAAHSRWGGGRALAPSELASLLSALAHLQEAGDAVVASLLPQLDPDLLREDDAFMARFVVLKAAMGAAGSSLGAVAVANGRSPLADWTSEFIHSPSTMSFMYTLHGTLRIFSNAAYRGSRPFDISVPADYLSAFERLYTELTGMQPCGGTMMGLLHFRHWRVVDGVYGGPGTAPGSGGAQAVGWGFTETIHQRQ